MDKQLNARISPDTYKRVKSAQADSKLTLNTLVEQLLEIGLDAYLKGNVATDSNSYVSQSDFDSFRGEILGKLSNLTELLSQVESIAPVQVGNVKAITYDLNKSDGSVVLRSIKGTHVKTFKNLSDADLAAIGLVRRADKFHPIA